MARQSNPDSRNRLGDPVAYALLPEGQPSPAGRRDASIRGRATFATKHLWVTATTPRALRGRRLRQPARRGAGLPASSPDRELEDTDLVVWHTFGLTHVPRPEDWPIMPVDYTGFTLKPVGFFDRNPTLDVPPSATHCSTTHATRDQG